MNFEDLKNPELQEKLKSAMTPDELLTLLKEEGYELSDEVLDGIAGGGFWDKDICQNNCPSFKLVHLA